MECPGKNGLKMTSGRKGENPGGGSEGKELHQCMPHYISAEAERRARRRMMKSDVKFEHAHCASRKP